MLKPQTEFKPMNSSRENDLEGQTITLTDEKKGTVKSIGNAPAQPKPQSTLESAGNALKGGFNSAKDFVIGRKEPEP